MTHTIRRLGHKGDGIADGPVYAMLTLPGEEIDGAVVDGRIAQPRIVTPSANRVRPPCKHFKTCGGCALQHAHDDFVADWKQQVVRQALQAHGIEAPFRTIQTSPAASRRRATLAGRRGKSAPIVGFHARGSANIVAIAECHLLHPDLMQIVPRLGEIVTHGASRKGEIALQITGSDGGIDLAVSNAKPFEGAAFAELAAFADRLDLARLSWNGERVVERRPPAQSFGRAQVVPPPGAFLQATAQGEGALVAAMRDAVGNAKKVADLFAGCGTFALPLAENAEVHAVEGDAAMTDALDAGWRHAQGLKTVTTEARDLFRRPLEPDELNAFDAVTIDPPRAGAEAQTARLAASDVPVIGAVSCNPATFARDAAALIAGGYTLNWVQVVDQFRWSPHIELAAQFTQG
ncbi:RNA methyltransferase [Actibacterium mucosum KCTC 23349]|uniref:RNA methyltransferase n=1 Tax=Actibacterium mucosum KCTC 23349 TaxID=1454373 RepID=A0A037ZME9_9RHOB|nr:class I SAM-dependent RNA methyltransferase [Actibacterium mucosum]KAJ57274.1 RNA methyltransferase [Actibacterium mucosum KCTC 23349]